MNTEGRNIQKSERWEYSAVEPEYQDEHLCKEETVIQVKENLKIIRTQQNFIQSLQTINVYFEELLQKISSSQDEWDKLGFKAINQNQLNKVMTFVNDILYKIWDFKIELEIPEILPCTDGSININFEMTKYNLLINFPSEEDELLDYYGKFFENNSENIIGKCSFEMLKELVYKWLLTINP